MYLAEIKETVSKFGETISKILDIDVMIIDSNYNRVANTFRYLNDPVPINRYSVLGEVLYTGKPIALRDKATFVHCKNCPDSNECTIIGLVGVPIFLEKKVVGAIALLVPSYKIDQVFKNIDNSIDFLEGMSDLLSSKIKSIDSYSKLNVITKERETIIEMIEDGIVFVNDLGKIVHYNHKFESLFKIDTKIEGENIQDILEHPLINEIMMFRENISYKLFHYGHTKNSFYGLLSCRNLIINGTDHGALLTFKSIGKAYNVLNEILDNKAQVTFGNIWGKDEKLMAEINKAKRLSVTDENILIYSEPGLGESALARAIHNFSDRTKQYFVYVDCEDISYDILETEIFGNEDNGNVIHPAIGKIRMAHKGTIFFKNISRMPMYLQRRLVNVIKTKELKQKSYNDFNIDVRMIFQDCEDLLLLVKEDSFDEELYYRISKNVLTIPSLSKRREDIKIIVDEIIEKLKLKYQKVQLEFDNTVLDMMYNYSWPNNIYEIEKSIDMIIAKASNHTVAADDVSSFDFAFQKDKDLSVVDEMEKGIIRKMLTQYNSKEQIAKAMGISRTTLYRKFKKYDIQ